MDVGAIDAEIVQFAVAHAAEFGNRLTVLAPVVERACDVHFEVLPEVRVSRLPLSGAGLDLMVLNICCAAKWRHRQEFRSPMRGVQFFRCEIRISDAVWSTIGQNPALAQI